VLHEEGRGGYLRIDFADRAERRIELTAEEEVAILAAYNYGLTNMGEEEIQQLHAVLAKLKDQIHP